jgi:hypothetical protein
MANSSVSLRRYLAKRLFVIFVTPFIDELGPKAWLMAV